MVVVASANVLTAADVLPLIRCLLAAAVVCRPYSTDILPFLALNGSVIFYDRLDMMDCKTTGVGTWLRLLFRKAKVPIFRYGLYCIDSSTSYYYQINDYNTNL